MRTEEKVGKLEEPRRQQGAGRRKKRKKDEAGWRILHLLSLTSPGGTLEGPPRVLLPEAAPTTPSELESALAAERLLSELQD